MKILRWLWSWVRPAPETVSSSSDVYYVNGRGQVVEHRIERTTVTRF